MQRHFTKILAYDQWAMNRIAQELETNGITDETCLKLLSHIVQAYRHWLDRFHNGRSSVLLWEEQPLDVIMDRYEAFCHDFEQFLRDQSDVSLKEMIRYENSRGQPFQQPLEDLLIHVFNHATHHRGQIVSRIRHLGYDAPVTDYIYYLRQNK